jgi:PAS domain S-box-containing protein
MPAISKTAKTAAPDLSALIQHPHLLVEQIADYAIYLLTVDGIVASWNAGARRIKGYADEEIIGQHFSRFYTAEDRATGLPARAIQCARDSGKFEDEGWRVRKDGTRFWASVVIDALRKENGELLGFAKITRDISDKKRALDSLRDSEERFRLLVQGVVDHALYMLSPDGHITNWNVGAERIKGYTAEEAVGSHFSRFYRPEDQARNLPMLALRHATEHGHWEDESWRVRKDGVQFFAHVAIDAIRDERGELLGFAKVTRDITQSVELKKAHAALAHSQKLESVGKLTGGVAHDFNNILQVIGGNLQLLGAHLPLRAPGAAHLDAALLAVQRGARLSSQLLAFARRQPLQPVVASLGRRLADNEDLIQRALGETIRVECVIAGALWNTSVDPNQFDSVLLNLAINARDAMPDGGKLTLEAGNAMLDDHYVAALPDVPPGQYVVVSVSDTGCGMSKEVVERAVEPFYSTKPEGQGTGLGLSMAFGFVKQSGGHFRLYSEPGHGTTVKMYFPRSHDSEAVLPVAVTTPSRGGNETILVVEDDLSVQKVVVEMLRSLGYAVLKADNPDSALSVLRSGAHCDLLFTDVVMPGSIKSTELAKQAKALLPALQVLFTSGYTQNAIIHGGRLDPGVQLLSKPYGREDLARKVRQLLDDPERAAATPPPAAVAAPVAGKRILLVEDDPAALSVTAEILTMMGHQLSAVGSAEAALALLPTTCFDMLLTDIRLPGMDGLALAHRMRQQQPSITLIFISGAERVGGEVRQLGGKFLQKPYTLAALRALLESS